MNLNGTFNSSKTILSFSDNDVQRNTTNFVSQLERRNLISVVKLWELVRSGVWYGDEEDILEASNDDGTGPLDSINQQIRNTIAAIENMLEQKKDLAVSEYGGQQAEPVSLYNVVVWYSWTPHGVNPEKLDNYNVSQLECLLEAFRSLSSPWKKLPPELLSEIFHLCVPRDSTTIISTSDAPLLLGRICVNWYSLSTGTPHLWTNLTLTSNFIHDPKLSMYSSDIFSFCFDDTNGIKGLGKGSGKLMYTFLERSCRMPISLSVHVGMLLGNSTRHPFYDHILDRCTKLALLLPSIRNPRPKLLDIPVSPFSLPLVEDLTLYSSRSGYNEQWYDSYDRAFAQIINTSASKLKKLNVIARMPTNLYQSISWNVSWHTLTHFIWVTPILCTDCHTLLHAAPNLVRVSVSDIFSTDSVVNIARTRFQPPVVMKYLETLVVGIQNQQTVFNAITAPELHQLVYIVPCDEDKESFMTFLSRSNCDLQVLKMYTASYSSCDIMLDVLERINSLGRRSKEGSMKKIGLKTLLIGDSTHDHRLISNKLLERLTYQQQPENSLKESIHPGSSTSTILFPDLEFLGLYDIGSITTGKISSLLRSRVLHSVELGSSLGCNNNNNNNNNSELKIAKLKVFESWHRKSNAIPDSDWDSMEELKSSGLVFRLFESPTAYPNLTEDEQSLLKKYFSEGFIAYDYLFEFGELVPIYF